MAFLAQLHEAGWLLIVVALVLYIADKYRRYLRLRAFKGPFGTGWSELWHSSTILSLRSHLIYKEVCDKYGMNLSPARISRSHVPYVGSIARIGPNELITSSPELLAHMNAVRSPYTRSTWFNRATRVEPGKDHVFSVLDEGAHAKRRAQMAAGVSASAARNHVKINCAFI